MGKFARSWALMKASASVLRSDKELMVFPLFSAMASLVVIASFALPIIFGSMHGEQFDHRRMEPIQYVLMGAFYLVQYTIIIFFNTALIGAAMIRLDGGNPTVADGFRIAWSRIGTILGYALIAATVGVFLRALQQRLGFIGRIIAGFLGLGWTVATFLVVPVLAHEGLGPFKALKRSVQLLRGTWGENLIGNVGLGVVFGLGTFLVMLCGAGLIVGAAFTGSVTLIVAAVVVLVIAMVLLGLVQAALHGIYSAALYRYSNGEAPGIGFDRQMLENAFRTK
ncbi:MAG TPA: DUF6159 family protein [Pinirhizobacter sp.]|uniref:DUF6159 family protein n=1 Tax=Pinirhizobacter sp. TaxID=2950432 RepID=UPI002C09A4F6|nr:DUF6159 family protein [Pinirhizobacter sp.]HMH67849.1 DUF6159 family protein [Pinirhizobacter sp.]